MRAASRVYHQAVLLSLIVAVALVAAVPTIGSASSAEAAVGHPDTARFTYDAHGELSVARMVVSGGELARAYRVARFAFGHSGEARHVYDSAADPVAPSAAGLADDAVTTIGSKISGQMGSRGWSQSLIDDTLAQPSRTVITRDTRWTSLGTRLDDPATAYIRADGSYVVRNDLTGDIVQISNRNDPNWIAPWD